MICRGCKKNQNQKKTSKQNYNRNNTFFFSITGLAHRRKAKLTIISFNFVCIFIENIILPSCDHTLLNVYSSLAFSNILILSAVKLSVTLIPVPLNFFLFLYIPITGVYLTNFTIIERGFGIFRGLRLAKPL